jgi:peptidyl-prolyl cis-trans isomerase SurA
VKPRKLLPVRVWVWILVTAASAGSVGAQQSEVIDRIVAVVNSDIITLYDLNRAFKPYEANIKALRYPADKERQTLFQVRSDLLNQLIDGQLADQQTKHAQISVSQKEIDTTIERMKEARSFTDEQLREGLAAQGITMEEYRKEIESQILRTKLVNREVKSKIVVTQEDIKAYYDGHQEKYAGEKKYYLWNLFIKASGADKNEALKAMKGVEIKLKTVEFSEILETNFGYQIIYVQKVQDTQAKPIEEVEAEIQQILYDESVDNKYQDWLEELRARSHIRIIN